jgi:hypothetical protein
MDIREVTMQLEMLTMSLSEAREIDRIQTYLASIERVSVDSFIAIYEMTGSDNLRFVLLIRLKSIFLQSKHLITFALIEKLWLYFSNNAAFMENRLMLNIFIEILALSFVVFSKEIDLCQGIKRVLESLRANINGNVGYGPNIAHALAIFLNEVADLILMIYRNKEDESGNQLSSFKTPANFFKVKNLTFCVDIMISLISVIGEMMSALASTNHRTKIADSYQVALIGYLKLINIENCIQKNLDFYSETYFGISQSNLASVFPIKNTKENTSSWLMLITQDFIHLLYKNLMMAVIRESEFLKPILETTLKVYFTAASLAINIFNNPNERSALMRIICQILKEITKDEKLISNLRVIGQNFNLVLILSTLTKTFLFESFQSIWIENQIWLSDMFISVSLMMRENIMMDEHHSLSFTVIADFIYFLYSVQCNNKQLFLNMVQNNEPEFYQFLFDYIVKRIRKLMVHQVKYKTIADEFFEICSALAQIMLGTDSNLFEQVLNVLATSNEEATIVLFLMLFDKVIDQVPFQHLETSQTQTFSTIVSCSNNFFNICVIFSQLGEFTSPNLVTIHYLISKAYNSFFKKTFKSTAFNSAEFMRQVTLLHTNPVDFAALYLRLILTTFQISKHNFNQDIASINTESFKGMFEYVMIGKNSSVSMYLLSIPSTQFGLFSSLLIEHESDCYKTIFGQNKKECKIFYECLTKIVCTLSNKNFGIENPEANIISYLHPVAALMNKNFGYFSYVFEGISKGLKGGFNEVLSKFLVANFLQKFNTCFQENYIKGMRVLIQALINQMSLSNESESKKQLKESFTNSVAIVGEVTLSQFAQSDFTNLSANDYRNKFSKPAMLFVTILKVYVESYNVQSVTDLAQVWQLCENVVISKIDINSLTLYLNEFKDLFYFVNTLMSLSKNWIKVVIHSSLYTKILAFFHTGLETTSFAIYRSILDFHIYTLTLFYKKNTDEHDLIANAYSADRLYLLMAKRLFIDLLFHEKSWSSKILECLYQFFRFDANLMESLASELAACTKEIHSLYTIFSQAKNTNIFSLKESHLEMIKKELNIQ